MTEEITLTGTTTLIMYCNSRKGLDSTQVHDQENVLIWGKRTQY